VSEALGAAPVAELCAGLLPECGPVRAVSRFAEGSITGAYLVEFAAADAAPVVLKVYEGDSLWCATKEAHALRFLTGHGIDISPRLLAVSPSAAALGGRPCVVSSLRPRRTLAAVDAELTRAQHHDVYWQLGQVLKRLHAIPAGGYGYIIDEIRDPAPDNAAHMARTFDRELRRFRRNVGDPALADRLAARVAARASAFADCARPAYCHGDVHEPNLLVQRAADGSYALTGLLDPLNLHAGDPLMDFVRLDAFSMHGDATKLAGLLSGYGVRTPPEQPGTWPEAWRARLPLYRIALALELYNWFSSTGETRHLPALDSELRRLLETLARQQPSEDQ
jgi:hygromycin-B 7''-O-kinase